MNNRGVVVATGLALATAAAAQTKGPQQVVKPPVAQAWIDVATFAGMGMPMGGGAAGPMGMLGGMLGGGAGAKNTFGMTQAASAGRWVDVTLYTSRNPSLAEALQSVPQGTQLAPTLKLMSPTEEKGKPVRPDDDTPIERDYERPKGKMLLYWGCGDTVRPGQPRVVDFATAAPADFQKFFIARSATQRGTHSAVGRPHWPSRDDTRMVPANASLVGEHGFTGQGVPEGFRFAIPAAQDIMPPIELAQRDAAGATVLEWKALPTARAQAAPGEREQVPHCAASPSARWRPKCGRRLASWLTSTIAVPALFASSKSRERKASRLPASSAEVGSSASTSAGRPMRARAAATRCCCPTLSREACRPWIAGSARPRAPRSLRASATSDPACCAPSRRRAEKRQGSSTLSSAPR